MTKNILSNAAIAVLIAVSFNPVMAASAQDAVAGFQQDKQLIERYRNLEKKRDALSSEIWHLETYMHSHRSMLENYEPGADLEMVKPQVLAHPSDFEKKISHLKGERTPIQKEMTALLAQLSPNGKKTLMNGQQ